MRVVLVQPSSFISDEITVAYRRHGRYKVHEAGGKIMQISLPPLGLLYLATPMVQAGHDVQILDAWSLQLTAGETLQEIIELKPDLVGLTMYFNSVRENYQISQQLKRFCNVPIVIGGPHASAAPKFVLEKYAAVDAVFEGWGDRAGVKLLDCFAGKMAAGDVPGLWYRQKSKFAHNAPDVLPSNLDDIPIPNRSLIQGMYDRRYYYNILSRRKQMDVLMTSRNCPFKCKFCFNLGKHGYYPHSTERVLEEIVQMVNRGVDAIEILDDTFTVNRKRAEQILDKIIESGFDLEFRIRSRVNLVNEQFLRKFKRSGGRAVSYGMESGSDKVLNLMDKGTTVRQNEKACRITKKAGLICHSSWLAGFPGETPQDLQKTFALIRKILPTTFKVYPLIPIPGSHVYKDAKEKGTLVGDWDVEEPTPSVRNEAWSGDTESFFRMLGDSSRAIYLKPRYLLQTARHILFPPSTRMIKYGFFSMLGLVPGRLGILKKILNRYLRDEQPNPSFETFRQAGSDKN
jgi:anaerobic magnesium-protoporphyrin IX monomethyl ester cyclase